MAQDIKKSLPLLPTLVLLTSSTFWGISWLPLKYFNSLGIAGFEFIFISHAILALMLLPFVDWRLLKSSLKNLCAVGLAGGTGIFCFTYALIYGDVIRVMVLFYLLPVWGVLGGKIFLNEHVGTSRWVGVLLALLGAYLILGSGFSFSQLPSFIDVLALLSGMAFAANNILFRGLSKQVLPNKMFAMFIGCCVVTGLAFISSESWSTDMQLTSWIWFFIYAVVCIMLANLGSQWAITQMEAGRSSVVIIMQLLAAVVSAAIIGGERMTTTEYLGCVCVILAAVLEAILDFKNRKKGTN